MTSNSRLLVLLLSSAILGTATVLADYPPESENGHSYYNPHHSQGAPSSSSSSSSSSSRSVTTGGRGGTSFVSGWSDRDWQVLNRPRCVEIPWNLTLCRNIGYAKMRLPNLLEHADLREVTQQAASWVRLTHIGCHPDAQIFLCSLFAPVCLDQPVWPCQTLCEAVKAGCERKMLQYGFPWPDMLRCDKFPSGTNMCMETRSNQEIESNAESSCVACSLPESVAAVITSLCQSDFVIRAKVEQRSVNGTDLKLVVAKKKKIYRTGTLKPRDFKEGVVYIEGGARCHCPPVPEEAAGGGGRADDHVIIAGNRTEDDRLTVSFIQNVRSKSLRPILRNLRRKDACRSGRNSKGKEQNKKNEKKTKTTTTMESPRSSEEGERTNPGTKGKKMKKKTEKLIQNRETSKSTDPPARNSSKAFVVTTKANKKAKAKAKANRKASRTPLGQGEMTDGATEAAPAMRQREKVTTSSLRTTKRSALQRRRPVVISTEPDPGS